MIQRINKKHEKSSSRKRSGFVYKERSPDSVKKRAEQTGGRFDSIFKSGFDVFRPKQGSNTIRFLPPTWDDHDHYGLDIYVHGFIGPNKGSYLCLQKMKNKRCPLCDLADETRKAGEQEEANQIVARKRVLAWIMDRDADENTPMLWSMGWTHDRDISDLARNKKTGETLLLDHPEEGFDVSFTRKGTTKTNTDYYGWQIDRDSSPIAERQKEQDEILEYIAENPLPDLLHYVDAEKLEAVAEGTAEEPDEDAEEEEEDRPRKKAKAKRRDEEEEDDESVEDEDEDRPARKKARRDAEDDEEEDDSDRSDRRRARTSRRRDADDEDEEDEAPRKKKSRSVRDEDDETDDADEESDDDDERPTKKRSSRDEPDEDEEEEDKKPAKRVRTRPSKDEEEGDEDEDQPRKKKRRDDDDEEEEDDE